MYTFLLRGNWVKLIKGNQRLVLLCIFPEPHDSSHRGSRALTTSVSSEDLTKCQSDADIDANDIDDGNIDGDVDCSDTNCDDDDGDDDNDYVDYDG